ncbi:MAG: hypothetical protein V1745_01145 [Patescibacteria group bacterium]
MPKKRDTCFGRTRPSNKRPLDWTVIDIAAFNAMLAAEHPVDHHGKFLASILRNEEADKTRGIRPSVGVATATKAMSTEQARYCAANGGSPAEMVRRWSDGAKHYHTYRDTRKFAVVETVVLQRLLESREIPWDLDEVRRDLFEQRGMGVLDRLCARFFPKLSAGSEEALSIDLRKKAGRTFRIVDMDEFRASYATERANLAKRCGARSSLRVHEGALLKRATCPTLITAKEPWRALQIYRERVQGAMHVLPYGMFMPIASERWKELIDCKVLPKIFTHPSWCETPEGAERDRATLATSKPSEPPAPERQLLLWFGT